jgi:hypothetical protein
MAMITVATSSGVVHQLAHLADALLQAAEDGLADQVMAAIGWTFS